MTAAASTGIPLLCHGDHLSRDEFERRYAAMPECKKAELIEGMVYLPGRVRADHGEAHLVMAGWLGSYTTDTPKVSGANNSTLRLDWDNEPQPDLLLRILPEHGGSCRPTADDYLEGPPELVIEIAASSVSYDLHQKLHVYRRSGVREYLVWRTEDRCIDWFVLRGGRYELLVPDVLGTLRSEVTPGLWLDPRAMLSRDYVTLRARLKAGLASPEYAAFAERP